MGLPETGLVTSFMAVPPRNSDAQVTPASHPNISSGKDISLILSPRSCVDCVRVVHQYLAHYGQGDKHTQGNKLALSVILEMGVEISVERVGKKNS